MGYLFFQDGILHQWSKRWVVFRAGLILLFTHHTDQYPSLTLAGDDQQTLSASVQDCDEASDSYLFEVRCGQTTPLVFRANSASSLSRWILRCRDILLAQVSEQDLGRVLSIFPSSLLYLDDVVPMLWCSRYVSFGRTSMILSVDSSHQDTDLKIPLLFAEVYNVDPVVLARNGMPAGALLRYCESSVEMEPSKEIIFGFRSEVDSKSFSRLLTSKIRSMEEQRLQRAREGRRKRSGSLAAKLQSAAGRNVSGLQRKWFSVTHSGWLTKRGGFFPTWRRRFFVLYQGVLLYYADIDDEAALGWVDLTASDVSVREATRDFQREGFPFEVVTSNRIYYFYAPSERAKELWVRSLQFVITNARESMKPGRGPGLAASVSQSPGSALASSEAVLVRSGERSGWAMKEGQRTKTWKRRFLVLNRDGIVTYYEQEPTTELIEDVEPKGSVFLGGGRLIIDNGNVLPQLHALSVELVDRTFRVAFDSDLEIELWSKAIYAATQLSSTRISDSATTSRHHIPLTTVLPVVDEEELL